MKDIEQLALWLTVNHRRPNWEVIGLIAKAWPDVTAAEINRAWHRMHEITMENFEKSVEPIKERARFRAVEDEHGGESD